MSAYVLCRIEVTDPTMYESYKALASAAISETGGRYLVRGAEVELLEGDYRGERIVVLEFPDKAAARAWYDGEAYREPRDIRQKAARSTLLLVEGTSA